MTSSTMEEFEHLEIQLEKIKSATNNFDKTKKIGSGGFGDVYEGEISHFEGRSKVAIKRLIRRSGQGDPEFLKEIATLSRYRHKNLITLLGFCDQDGEKILVYEHAARGSLDRHLSSTNLTWTRRIKICLDAARGLNYLHDPREMYQRVIHRDIKSSNILLDGDWNARVSDMGLSKVGPANQQHTELFTNIAGTPGYCDPLYFKTYTLTKEVDVYSFGVVMFEVLCGRLCYQMSNGRLQILVPEWEQSYQEKKLDTIIFQGLVQPMDPIALETFSGIAFQCLQKSRPTMALVVEKLEIALKFQEPHDLTMQNEEITPLTDYSSIGPEKLLSKGVIFSGIAFQCLQKSRPTMALVVEKLEIALKFQEPHDLTVQNEEITLTDYSSIGPESSKGEEKGRPLPKFGDWDDPASAVGYTVIFNKSRDDKEKGGNTDSPSNVDPGFKHGAPVKKPPAEEKGRPLLKFGDWEVYDPAAAEGFTVIFNKARDEKKTGGNTDSPSNVDPGFKHGAPVKKPPAKKWYCCLQAPHTES